ncbi:MAG TPA: hypothetical protein VF570_18600 [Pyrinomonadaceae bacterium]|jgi:hypothetical protein
MKIRELLKSALLACVVMAAGVAAEVTPPRVNATGPSVEPIRFQITAHEESAAGRRIISDATVEGPPGMDFKVNLEDGRFKVGAGFLTDLAPGGGLTLRVRLDTRRLYGYSEAGLPLYEEDAQRHTLRVGFDEAVVLLPFGGGGDEGRLSIEITPARPGRAVRAPSGEATAPEIRIDKPSPGGAISIEASNAPHDFVVEAALLEDGREVARGAGNCLLEEARELLLQSDGGGAPLALNLTVERLEPDSKSGRTAVRFDLLGGDPARPDARAVLARNWAGVGGLNSEFTYDLSRTYPGQPGRKYELKFRIKLASGGAAGR